MSIWVLTDRPDHEVVKAVISELRRKHVVVAVDAATSFATDDELRDVDVALLKAHSPAAISLARRLQQLGAEVVNSADPTEQVLDRIRMAEVAQHAGLPFASTVLAGVLADLEAGAVPYPLIVKSQISSRHDLVAAVDNEVGLSALTVRWADEPVIVQRKIQNDGWDHKVWVAGERTFYGRRRSPIDGAVGQAEERTLDDLGETAHELSRAVGEAYDLSVFGVDFLFTSEGPIIVDVNAFPGFRGMTGAADAIASVAIEAYRSRCARDEQKPGVYRDGR